MLQYLCLALLISSVINAEVLVYPLNLYHVDSGKFTTELYFQKIRRDVRISLGSSEFLIEAYNSDYNISKINVKYDNDYPEKPTSGYITTGIFNVSRSGKDTMELNVLYNNTISESILGLARSVKYPNKEIEGLYDLDFMSQLLKKKVINEHYIYLTPFFKINGELEDKPQLELGRMPSVFGDKSKFSYTPLNKLYPTKWASKLSHIFLGDINENNIYEIHADVIFTETHHLLSYIPEKLRPVFKPIFDKMNCEYRGDRISCPIKTIQETKFYLVFNGYAHLIPGNLLFHYTDKRSYSTCSFEFTTKIDYIKIDSRIFGSYHRLYDGEDNTIRFAYPKDPNFIVDVKDITGYERRFDDEISIVYLKDWERRLKKRELAMNETLKEFNEREKNYKARIEYLESQIEELNDKLKDNKEIIWHLINNCNNKTKIY